MQGLDGEFEPALNYFFADPRSGAPIGRTCTLLLPGTTSREQRIMEGQIAAAVFSEPVDPLHEDAHGMLWPGDPKWMPPSRATTRPCRFAAWVLGATGSPGEPRRTIALDSGEVIAAAAEARERSPDARRIILRLLAPADSAGCGG